MEIALAGLLTLGLLSQAWAQTGSVAESTSGVPTEAASARPQAGRLSRLTSGGPVSLSRLLEATVSVHPTVRAKQGELQAAGFDLEGANWARFPIGHQRGTG